MGTNVFIIGEGKERLMVDAADYPEKNALFLEGLKQIMID